MDPETAIRLLKGQVAAGSGGDISDVAAWRTRSASVLRRAIGEKNPLYEEFNRVKYSPQVFSTGTPDSHFRDIRIRGVRRAIGILDAAILEVEESLEVPAGASIGADEPVQREGVFLVHGHDARKDEVARAISRLTGEEPTILHEQPNRGQTIIEKFEMHASARAFAVVLATGDDLCGAAKHATFGRRARQNVIFEMGFFVAALGRQRVAVLHDQDVELPSDYDGMLYIPLDDVGRWRTELSKEMRAAGIDADANRL